MPSGFTERNFELSGEQNSKNYAILTEKDTVVTQEDTTTHTDDDKILPFLKLMPGDLDGNWLWGLPEGTVFLCAPKAREVLDKYNRPTKVPEIFVKQLHVIQKVEGPQLVKLLENTNEDHFDWVDSGVFSAIFDLKKVQFRGTDV